VAGWVCGGGREGGREEVGLGGREQDLNPIN